MMLVFVYRVDCPALNAWCIIEAIMMEQFGYIKVILVNHALQYSQCRFILWSLSLLVNTWILHFYYAGIITIIIGHYFMSLQPGDLLTLLHMPAKLVAYVTGSTSLTIDYPRADTCELLSTGIMGVCSRQWLNACNREYLCCLKLKLERLQLIQFQQ